MTNKPIENSECPNPRQCAEGAFWDGGTNRILWATIEQSVISGRQGVCYVFPPSVVICFSVNTINRHKTLHPKPGRWWEFWK